MSRQVRVRPGQDNVLLGGGVYDPPTVVTITDEEFKRVSGAVGTAIDDLGPGAGDLDAVVTQAPAVLALGALTSAVVAAAPTAAEHNALRADVQANRTAINAMLAALKGAGRSMSAT